MENIRVAPPYSDGTYEYHFNKWYGLVPDDYEDEEDGEEDVYFGNETADF